MPIYTWYDKLEDKEYEVFKEKFDQSAEEPTDEELPEEARGKIREWVKHLGRGVKIVRGANWSGSKGNWVALLGGLGWILQQYQDMIL